MSEMILNKQIKTTLSPAYRKIFDNICEQEEKKESEVAREAIIKYLQSYFSNKVIQTEKQMQTA